MSPILRPVPLALVLALPSGLLPPAASAQSDVKQLDQVVVTATGYEQAVEDAPASISVLPREELEKRSYRDITDALKDVPGVVVTGGASSSDISIRGMSSAYTLILIDGKRQNSRETRPNSDNAGIEQGWLPPLQAIERIEVIRGPMSSLYGSEAMGGVINIITRKVHKEWTGSVRAEGTFQEDRDSGDIHQGSVYLAGPIQEDRLGLQFYGQQVRRQEDEILNGFNRQDTRSGTLKLTLTPNADHDLVAEVGRTLQTRTATPGKTVARENCARGACTPNVLSESKYARDLYSLRHAGRWGWATSNTYVQRDETANPGRDMFLTNTEFNTQWTLPLASHTLTGGFQFLREELRDGGNQYAASVNRLERKQWAVFAEDEWSLTERFALTGGLRMTHDEHYGSHWTPRLYGVWHASDTLSVKGGVSTGFKAPGLRQAVADWGQITGGGGVPAIIMGNPDLKPEKSLSQELGVVWDNRSNLSASLTLFNTDFKDKIAEVRTCTDPANQPNCHVQPGDQGYKFISERINVDKAVMRGVEATATWSVTERLRLAANYTYTHSKQKSGPFEGQPLNKMPRHMANATLDWDATERIGLWSRVNFRGRTSEYLSRTAMADGTPSHTFVDVGLNYRLNKHTSFGVGVYNVLDKRIDYEDFDTVLDGRRYWAQMTVGF
ncbi:ligand-gated channel protein [Castellaniella defragrans]|uniref:ligand-gated channel protein n=1 Tax=Castellaniella defragrans TaxID=75697 RepID=UPI0023F0867B|nr:ligand-gated channel protein [Castellaniella defragrans]